MPLLCTAQPCKNVPPALPKLHFKQTAADELTLGTRISIDREWIAKTGSLTLLRTRANLTVMAATCQAPFRTA